MKSLLVLYSPITTFSGYGSRGRDLAHALIQLKEPEFDVRFIACNWGNCPHGALDINNPKDKLLLDRILPGGQLSKQPEIWIMHTIPTEMQRLGSAYNILITAGMESTICLPEWVNGCNVADLIITSSEHAKRVFESSTFDQFDNRTKQKVGVIKVTKPIEVLFEGLNTSLYKKIDSSQSNIIPDIPEDFAFLCVGHWLPGEFNQDRKNISGLIKIFFESFKNKTKAPALILKVSSAAPSVMDREDLLDRIYAIKKTVKAQIYPSIYLLNGELTDEQMNEVYAHPKVKSFVLLTRGEGFGRPLLEFSVQQKPIITTGWSGHLDFLDPKYNILLPGQIEKIHPSAVVNKLFHPESSWFTVNASEASHAMKDVYMNYQKYLEGAKRQAYKSKTEFSLEKMTEKLDLILKNRLPKLSIPVSIKLPTLKPVSLKEN